MSGCRTKRRRRARAALLALLALLALAALLGAMAVAPAGCTRTPEPAGPAIPAPVEIEWPDATVREPPPARDAGADE